MSSTTQPTDFSDLYLELLNKTRSVTTVTAVTNQARRYINSALYDLVIGFEHQLPWLEREAFIRTHAPYTTGTVAVTRGATAVTGTSTLWATVNAYNENNARVTGKMLFGGSDIYGISAVGSDTSITLDERYVADSDLAAGSTYTYFEDEYALASDFLKPVDWRIFSTTKNIPILGRREFNRKYPRPIQSGTPKAAVLLEKGFSGSTTPLRYIQFYPYPAGAYVIPYLYITSNLAVTSAGVEAAQLSGDTDEPNCPRGYRHLIVLNALYLWYRDKKDDARSQSAQADYIDGVKRVVGDTNVGVPKRATIAPRNQSYEQYARQPYSGVASGRRYSHNNSFDYLDP